MTTRGTLLAQGDSWLARDDLSAAGLQDILLSVAQATIDRRVRLRAQEASLDITATARATPLPDDFISMRAVVLNTTLARSLDYLTPERIRESPIWFNQGFRDAGDDIGASAYTIEGNDLILAPEPTTEGVPITIVYYRRFASLVDASDTNELLTNNFDVYLYAYLHAAADYLQEPELAADYERRFEKAVAEITRHERWGRFTGSALISTGNPRRTV